MDNKKRKVEDKIEIDGRTFILKKFDPMLGNYILVAISTMALPFGLGDGIAKALGTDPTEGNKTKKIDKEEFMDLQKDILSFCYELLPAGEAPIITKSGGYGVMNVTSKILMSLLIAEVAFNFVDFFEESPLTQMGQELTQN